MFADEAVGFEIALYGDDDFLEQSGSVLGWNSNLRRYKLGLLTQYPSIEGHVDPELIPGLRT
jgi:hypothetical protein